MSRYKGTFLFGANLEGGSTVPIDARQLVGEYADLTLPATWCFSPTCSTIAIYDGMIVGVGSDSTPANNGVYWLCDAANYTGATSWVKVGEGGGTSNLSGATNGLSLFNSGTCVGLGGELSGNTCICANSYTFEVGDGLANKFSFNSGSTQITHINPSTFESTQFSMCDDGTVVLNFSETAIITDGSGASPLGLQYVTDYKNSFTSNSLVSKSYVDNCSVTGASNGLNASNGRDVTLGGELVTDTTINTYGNLLRFRSLTGGTYFSLQEDSGVGQIINNVDVCDYRAYQGVVATSGSSTSTIRAANTNTGECREVCVSAHDTMEITDTVSSVGICYAGDYEDNFVPRSLVTKQYVSGVTSGLTSAFTTANNGLCANNQIVSLGGTLTGDTTISGAHTLCLGTLTAFNTTATNINLTGIVGVSGAACLSSTLTTAGATALRGSLNVTGTTTLGNTLTLSSVAAGTTSNPIMVIDGGVVKCVTASSFDVTASNGLTASGNNVKLGGSLVTGNTLIAINGYPFEIC